MAFIIFMSLAFLLYLFTPVIAKSMVNMENARAKRDLLPKDREVVTTSCRDVWGHIGFEEAENLLRSRWQDANGYFDGRNFSNPRHAYGIWAPGICNASPRFLRFEESGPGRWPITTFDVCMLETINAVKAS